MRLSFPRSVAQALLCVTLTGCGLSESLSKLSDLRADLRSARIHNAISSHMADKFGERKNTLWAETRLSFDDDWLVLGPESLWGAAPSDIPATLDCDARDSDCDPDFKRQLCNSDDDCGMVSSHCTPLAASVFTLGQEPKKMCLGGADKLLDRYYNFIVSTEHHYDLVSLSFPSGRFYTVLVHALSVLGQRGDRPELRLLFSGYDSLKPNFLNSPSKILKRLVADITALNKGRAPELNINLGWLASGGLTWNHAKLMVADAREAISGGHNMVDSDYVGDRPIFDLSMQFKGSAVTQARYFVEQLWSHVDTDWSSYPDNLGLIATPFVGKADESSAAVTEVGDYSAIAVGRMGSYGANPSDEAIRTLIDQAQTSVVIAQQELYKLVLLPIARSFAHDNIINAAARGVKVRIVISSPDSDINYRAIAVGKEYKDMLQQIVKRLRDQGLSQADAQTAACSNLEMAAFSFSRQIDHWPSLKKEAPGIHAKFVMVDDAAFYLGSQNLYPASLVEYGTIVTNAHAAGLVKDEYWDKVWQESVRGQTTCPY